ncbi:MAG: DUF1178 family protein [Litoreibacter sp.]
MICFALICDKEHRFDSWFGSGDDFDKLERAGHVSCPECGSVNVKKSIMAPRVSKGDTLAHKPLSEPTKPGEIELKKIREKIESSAENVGLSFAAEARAMHEGTAPERAIIGEAKPSEAKALLDEGIPVLPLPFTPTRKMN